MDEMILRVAILFPGFLLALCFHEYAHGWMAKRLGDDTAERMGRLTMNPAAHIDVMGTLVLPIISIASGWALFGWAKPVPFDARNLKDVKRDTFWIALAGPLSNVLLAVVGAFLLVMNLKYGMGTSFGATFLEFLKGFVFLNILLAVFNMIPLHPLDGGKVLARFLPYSANRFLEENQQMLSIILMGFLFMGGFHYLAGPMQFLNEGLIVGMLSLFA